MNLTLPSPVVVPLSSVDHQMSPGDKAKRVVKVVVCHVARAVTRQGTPHRMMVIRDSTSSKTARIFSADQILTGKTYLLRLSVIKNMYDSVLFVDQAMESEPLSVTPRVPELGEIGKEEYQNEVISDRVVLKRVFDETGTSLTKCLLEIADAKPIYLSLWPQDLEQIEGDLIDYVDGSFEIKYFSATTKAEHKSISLKSIRGLSEIRPVQ